MDFLLAIAAVFVALQLDRFVGSAVQIWSTRRIGQRMIKQFDSAITARQKQFDEQFRAIERRSAN